MKYRPINLQLKYRKVDSICNKIINFLNLHLCPIFCYQNWLHCSRIVKRVWAHQRTCLQTHCWGPWATDVKMSSGWRCLHQETAHKPEKKSKRIKWTLSINFFVSVSQKPIWLTLTREYCECEMRQQYYENKAESWCTLRAISLIHKLQIHAPPHPDLGTIHHEKSQP